MAKATIKRGACRAIFTKLHNALMTMFTAKDVDATAIIAKFRVLEAKYQELNSLNELVTDELCDQVDPRLSDEELEKAFLHEAESTSEYDEKFQILKLKIEALSQPPPSVVSVGSVGSVATGKRTQLKLPKFQFRQFSGEISQWIGFWSQFEPVHLDETLTEEEKFQYLIQATKPESKARALVENFPPSAKNYVKAIEQLKARFGRDELLAEHYVRELLSLVLFNATGKTSLELRELSDRLETQLLALESLGVTCEKYASMLYPLVESALPERVLRDWERYRRDVVLKGGSDDDTPGTKPDKLMAKLRMFLQSEVESDERVNHARNTFKNPKENCDSKSPVGKPDEKGKVATAADLVAVEPSPEEMKCVFCDSPKHSSEFCSKACEMNNDEKCKLLRSKRLCFRCLDKFHGTRRCKNVCCLFCKKGHSTSMCQGSREKKAEEAKPSPEPPTDVEHSYSNVNCSPVLMQTLKVLVKGDNPVTARLMIDTGSQHSYITRRLANLMNYKSLREENLVHALFGGGTTSVVSHQCYRIRVQNVTSGFSCNFEALDSENICHAVPAIPKGPWVSELEELNIPVTDTEEGAIDILVGSDVAGRLFTGKKHVLSCGLVALETSLGWTVMGRVRQELSNCKLNVATISALDLSPSEIQRLAVNSIKEPAEDITLKPATEPLEPSPVVDPAEEQVQDGPSVSEDSPASSIEHDQGSQENTAQSHQSPSKQKRKKRKVIQKCVVKECKTRCGRKVIMSRLHSSWWECVGNWRGNKAE